MFKLCFCLFFSFLSFSWGLFGLWPLGPGPGLHHQNQAGGRAADLHWLVPRLGLRVLGKSFWVPAHTLRTTKSVLHLRYLQIFITPTALSNGKMMWDSYSLQRNLFHSLFFKNKNVIWCQIFVRFYLIFFFKFTWRIVQEVIKGHIWIGVVRFCVRVSNHKWLCVSMYRKQCQCRDEKRVILWEAV